MGKRNFFYGTMNASKSAQLLIQAFNLERQGKSLVVFKPAMDTRDRNAVKSRALDEERMAIAIPSDVEEAMYSFVELLQDKIDFVFVDELQFMTPKQIEELARISIDFNKPIFAYGLLISYTGELFEGSKRAIECGFTLHELKIQCDFCSSKATNHILRIDGELITGGDGFHVGDQEYNSVCYPCYLDQLNKSKK